jgi:hypothetical protein
MFGHIKSKYNWSDIVEIFAKHTVDLLLTDPHGTGSE